MVKGLPADAGNLRDAGSVPGSECSEVGHGNLLQNSCWETSMDRGACGAVVHGATKSDATEHTNNRGHTNEKIRNFTPSPVSPTPTHFGIFLKVQIIIQKPKCSSHYFYQHFHKSVYHFPAPKSCALSRLGSLSNKPPLHM